MFGIDGGRPPTGENAPGDASQNLAEPLAVVVAESRYQAEDALEVIEVQIEELETIVDARRAFASCLVLATSWRREWLRVCSRQQRSHPDYAAPN